MKIAKSLIICSLICFFNAQTFAQVVADFTADKTEGCPPALIVSFTNKSTGTGTLTYSWTFGNGNTSTVENPQASFSNPGNFLVTLTVSNGTSSNSKSMLIKVFNPPVADFSANQKGCTPFSAQFTDLSTKGDGDITGWLWDFRNGTSSTDKNPLIQYNTEGRFSILLTVTDSYGCKGTIEKTNYIDVANKPLVSFVASPSTACKVPATVNFTNQSTGKGVLTYEWTFGNGSTGTSKNPIAIYSSFGSYNVSLKVNTDYGCSNSITVPAVNIAAVDAIGELSQDATILQTTDYACATEIKFDNKSVGNPNCVWNFGDNTTPSYEQTAFHTYTKSGTYTVKLIASPGNQCADTAKWDITIEKVEANFSLSQTSTCYEPVKIDFTNQSNSASSYLWTFHDNSTQTVTNPSYTYSLPVSSDPYQTNKETTFPVTLEATSQHGCKSSIIKSFIISKPTALLYSDIKEGCVPLTVNFTENSTSTKEQIILRKWIFGDGTETTTSTGTNAQHTFSTPGTYNAKLVINTLNCNDTSYNVTIKVGNKPKPDFQVTSSTPFYSSQPVVITDKTLATYNIDYWKYTIGDQNVSICPDQKDISVKYNSSIGLLPVTLTVGSNGCYEDTTFSNIIENLGPIGSFSYNIDCATPLQYAFTGTAQGYDSFKWEFGDGNTETSAINPNHTYAASGDYLVKFITFKSSYSDTSKQTIYVRQPSAQFTANNEDCINTLVQFDGSASHTIYTTCRDKYLWNFGDGSPKLYTSNNIVNHTYTDRGTYDITLKALYENGCTSNITKQTRIYAPYTGFEADTTSGCNNLAVSFTDTSKADVHPLTEISWYYADATAGETSAPGAVKTHTFTLGSGLYEYNFLVQITAKDNFGCSNTDTMSIRVSSPFADFAPLSLTSLCSKDSIKFMRAYPNPDSAIWDLGDGNKINSLKNPFAYKYQNEGDYGMSLTIYKYNCSSKIEMQTGYVRVQKADARFNSNDTIFDCPIDIKFDHDATMSPVDSGMWYFGDGYTGPYQKNPLHTYSLSGKYKVKLRVHTSFGCMDTFTRTIDIKGPIGNFTIDRARACLNDTVLFSLVTQDTLNVKSYQWDMGEGVFASGDPVKYPFKLRGPKTITLLLYGNKGAACPFKVVKPFLVDTLQALFNMDDSVFCEKTSIQFNHKSKDYTSISWNLGNGVITSDQSPITEYNPGNYNITLSAINSNNCKDTARRTLVINSNPTIAINNDTLICTGNNVLLTALTSGDSIEWFPNKWLTDSKIQNPVSTPDSTIKYNAYAYYKSTGCYASDSLTVSVQQQLNFNITPRRDTSIIIGEYIDLNVESQETYNLQWTPTTWLNCPTCAYNQIMPTDSITYNLHIEDVNNCFKSDFSFKIQVKDTALYTAPSAFLPNGDEENRILYVKGKGIKQLLSFKIFNRWGNLVFESNDLSKGWDGKYQGKDQPIDTYIYTITIETLSGKVLTRKGTVLLLR